MLAHWIKSQGILLHFVYKSHVGTIQKTVLAQSLSNFTCKLFMMRGGTLSILGHVINSQGHV